MSTTKGSTDVVVGANWGDEGKGRIVDYLVATGKYAVTGRFQGGANAGHTVINDRGRFVLHLLPSGVLDDTVLNVLGSGVALDMVALFRELDELAAQGITPQLRVSDRANLLLPLHKLLDVAEEERLGQAQFGSTRSGIAPFYSDVARKRAVQVADLWDEAALREQLAAALVQHNALLEHLYHRETIDVGRLVDDLLSLRERLAPFVVDTKKVMREQLAAGNNILCEGQLGTLKDVWHGMYPLTTSSCVLAANAAIGGDVPLGSIREVIAVTKAYSSAVGAGYMVSQYSGEEAETLRKVGGDRGEYGATTGRPREVGAFDTVGTRYGVQTQGATQVALTCLDVLGYQENIPVCVAYEIDGKRVEDYPHITELKKAKPIYEMMPGWNVPKEKLAAYDTWEKLPPNCRRYVEFIEQQIGVPVTLVSIGPKREQLICR